MRAHYDLWKMPFFISVVPGHFEKWNRPTIEFGSSLMMAIYKGAVMINYSPESGSKDRQMSLYAMHSTTCNSFIDHVCRTLK